MIITEKDLLDEAQFYPNCPNVGGSCTPKYIIMHFTCMMDRKSVSQYFMNPSAKVSSHLVLGTDGKFSQMAPFTTKTWHAGASYYQGHSDINGQGIGIEICNYGECNALTPDGKFVVPRRGESLPQEYRKVEDWIKIDGAWWQKYTEAQFRALDELVPLLVDHYKIRDVAGHSDIAVPKGRKNDPGPAFPMAHYKAFADYGNSGSMGNYVASIGDLNVRGGPGAEFAILAKLNRGDTVKVLKQDGQWMLVQYDKTKGYVHSAFLLKT